MRHQQILFTFAVLACSTMISYGADLQLWYDAPAENWNEALPIGNGRMGAMVFGGLGEARYQFNEDTLWVGEPRDYVHQGAKDHLQKIRQLLFEGKQGIMVGMVANQLKTSPLEKTNKASAKVVLREAQLMEYLV